MKLSIVSPVYGAASLLHELVQEIEAAVRKLTNDYEIILVEDHSPDDSQAIIREICKVNKHVVGVFHSRNFGQQYAIHTGLSLATGDYIVTMDCDLQDTPALIVNLFNKAQEGYDIVYASRQNRQDGYVKKLGSKIFNRLLGFLTETVQDETIANFVLYRKKVVDAMLQMGDYRRYYPLMNHWVGFKSCKLPIPHAERADGKASSYSMKKRIELALNTAVAFSTKPLRLIIYFGMFISAIAILLALFMAAHYIMTGITVSGWLTLFVSLWFIAGVMIMIMGIIAVYIGSVFEQTKNRPCSLVSEILNR